MPAPAAPPHATASLHVTARLDAATRERAWEVYRAAFEPLQVLAATRHLLTRAEFDALCADERVRKHLALDGDGDVCAFGTLTDDLAAVPMISEAYFAHRWPEHHAQRRIWYVGCLGVVPRHQRTGLLARLVAAMCEVVDGRGGIAAIDVCRWNEHELGLHRAVDRALAEAVPGARGTRLDEQVYWAWELPAGGGAAGADLTPHPRG
ncbi:hypothetical protein [Kineococcus sp. SYSU DK005]|uniref:hypothetical protein n=1 Tax=Kineococcus sp. SYSU DK005 TaxID=3383126 RepID=UPI003D7D84EC